MIDDFDSLLSREMIFSIRGGVPDQEHCDYCGSRIDQDSMYPEEGGLWICYECTKEAYPK